MRVTANLTIGEEELLWRFGPSGGPGGQHANTANTRAEVRFDIAGSPSLSDAQRELLLQRLGPVVVAASSDERSQLRNRDIARERLRARLAGALAVQPPRRPTRPSAGSVRRRLEGKRRQSDRKRDRQRPGDGPD